MSTSYLDSNRKGRNSGFTKHGSKADGTDGAHMLSHRVAAGILQQSPGRGGHGTGTGTSGKAISRAINTDANIRIKTQHGNRTLDDRRDKRIVVAHASGASLKEKTTADRAVQAYKGASAAGAASGSGAVNQIAAALGALTFNNGKPGRPKSVKSMAAGK